MIEAAAESTALKAIVSEGGSGRSVRDDFANGYKPPGTSASAAASSPRRGALHERSAAHDRQGIRRAEDLRFQVFFIYGERGQPEEEPANKGFYAVARGLKEIWRSWLHAWAAPRRSRRSTSGVSSPSSTATSTHTTRGGSHEPRPFRTLLLSTALLALAVVLSYWHPPGGQNVFEGVSPDVDAWLFVHTALLLAFPALGLAAFQLLRGVESRAATVSRVAVVLFLVFYTAYETTIGVGTGVLVDYANGLPPAEQAAVADAIQDYNRDWIVAGARVDRADRRLLRLGRGDVRCGFRAPP